MKSTLRFVLLAALFAGVAFGQDDPDVIVLGEDNFDEVVDAADLILVEFYAPWCGHCKRLAPEYAKAATELLAHDPPIKLAKVDATVHGSVASRFDVSGYPTLKVFRKGKAAPYSGPRDAAGIVRYMKAQEGPSAKPVESVADLQKYQEKNKYVVVGAFLARDTPLKETFLSLADANREDFFFAVTESDDVKAHLGIDASAQGIVALKNFGKKEDSQAVYGGKAEQEPMEQWVLEHSLPLVGTYDGNSAKLYRRLGLPVFRAFVPNVDWDGANAKHTNYFANRLRKAARERKDQIRFALSDSNEAKNELSEMGLADHDVPMVITDGDKKYSNTAKFNKQAVQDFVNAWLAGEAEQHIKSEPVPEDNDTADVVTVVGRNFEEIAEDDDKDVLIEFYAPWCGHCKKLAPTWEKLGKKMKKHRDTLTIAKIDATANDYARDRWAVSGFPTIYFKPAGGKPTKYSGAREVADFKKYIKKHATHKIGKN